ncbi:hypothetical protein LIS66_17490 [Pseudomonas sp. HN2]|uniref:hypothetical protein n=1 Tax=Pseudomonas sp. HN2 TaxID=2884805 RepID=UPI001D1582E3|nr:hypothetical protein [Pseudomonas sp. HN2]UEB94173.1 hypothetical protein LIS66_17490 [Pseudomonas sp. HN2]
MTDATVLPMELGVFKEGCISGIREVTPEELAIYKKHTKILAEFARGYELIQCVQDSFQELISNLIKVAHQQAGADHVLNAAFYEGLILYGNRMLLNVLYSVRTFLDHRETAIKRKFGKDSSQLANFKAHTALEFDSYFSYGFFYKLRNYTQHCGMPPLHFTMDHSPVRENEVKIEVTLDRDALLESYSEWGVIVKKQLALQAERFHLLPLLEEYIESITRIYLKCYFYECYLEVGSSRRWMCDFIGDDRPIDLYTIFTARPKNFEEGEGIHLNLMWVPTQTMCKVLLVEESLYDLGHQGS